MNQKIDREKKEIADIKAETRNLKILTAIFASFIAVFSIYLFIDMIIANDLDMIIIPIFLLFISSACLMNISSKGGA